MHTVSGPCAYSPAFPSLTPLQPCWPLWCAFYMPGKLLPQNFYPCHCCFVECVFLVILTGLSLTSFKSLINCCIISKVLYVKLTALLLITATASVLSSIPYLLSMLHFSLSTYHYLTYYIFYNYVFIVWTCCQHTPECTTQEGRDFYVLTNAIDAAMRTVPGRAKAFSNGYVEYYYSHSPSL